MHSSKLSEQSIQNKQKYLREKILDTGHDAQAFMGYCEQNYGQIDLQGWSFAKLKQIVSGFLGQKGEKTFTQQQLDNEQWCEYEQAQQVEEEHQPKIKPTIEHKVQHKQLVFSQADWGIFGLAPPPRKQPVLPQHNPKIAPNNLSMSPPSGIPTNSQPQINQVSSPRLNTQPELDMLSLYKQQANKNDKGTTNNVIDKKNSGGKQFQQLKVQQINQAIPNSKITQVGQLQIKVIKSKQLQQLPTITDVKIIKTEQKTRNFLQGDYTLYHIQFSPGNQVIQRKFSQFRKLRIILQKIYPFIKLPYLEPQGWLINSSEAKDPETLNKYKYMIVQFLKYITMRNQLLKKSKIVRIFTGLIEGTPTDFKKYQNIVKPKTFEQLCLPQGTATFAKYQNLSPVDKYMTSTQILSGNVDAHYQKLRKAMQTLFYNYEHVSKSLVEVAGIFQSLQGLIQKFNYENDNKKDLRVYEGLKEVCMKMKQSMDGQYSIFKNQIQSLFKYERDNMTTLKQINQTRSRMFYQYVKQNLHTKKATDLMPKDDTVVSGTMSIDEPCKNNKNILTIQNMFWSYYTLKNVEEYWNQLRYKINQQLTMIAYDELDAENVNLNFWNNVIKKCVI